MQHNHRGSILKKMMKQIAYRCTRTGIMNNMKLCVLSVFVVGQLANGDRWLRRTFCRFIAARTVSLAGIQ